MIAKAVARVPGTVDCPRQIWLSDESLQAPLSLPVRPVFYGGRSEPFPKHAVLYEHHAALFAVAWGTGVHQRCGGDRVRRLLLFERWSRLAAWGLIALLVAVFPANVHMALHTELYPWASSLGLWLRLSLQGALIVWAYWYTRPQYTRT